MDVINLKNIRRIYTLGDIHLGIRNNSVEWSKIQEDFLLDFFIKKLEETGFDPERDILIQEGDIFHSRESINVRIQNKAFRIFSELSKVFKRGIFVILGNHDVYYKDRNDINSLTSLSYLSDNIHIFEDPVSLNINDGDHKFYLLPWVEDFSKLGKLIKKNVKSHDYLVCHADIKGLKFNKWVDVKEGVDIETVAGFKRVYAGHIHHRQEYKNVLYTGTPYQMDRGDRGNTKGFYILDIDGKELKEEFIENSLSPKFVKYDLYEILQLNVDEIKSRFSNNFVDVMIDINFSNKFSVPRFLEMIKGTGYRKIEFYTYMGEGQNEDIDLGELNNDFNIFEIFETYLEHQTYDKATQDKLKTLFYNINKKVNNEKDFE